MKFGFRPYAGLERGSLCNSLFSAAETMIWYHLAKKYENVDRWGAQLNHNKITIPYSLKDIPLSRALFLTCPMAKSRVAIK